MENKDSKSRRYCFTIFDYERDLQRFIELAESLEKHRYICFGLEICPETKRPHIQGYIELNQPQRFKFIQNYFDFRRADGSLNKFNHCVAHGTAEQNKVYTGKEENFHEFGEPTKQGARNDLKEIKEAVKENPKNLNEIIDEHGNNFQQVRFAQILQPIYLKPRNPSNPPIVYWIAGETETGKSSLVYRSFSDVCSVSSYDWLGTDYNQNECFLMDDFRPDNLPFETLLKITDRYPFTLYFKGSQIPLNSLFIVITSPKLIDETYDFATENLQQLKRRVIQIQLTSLEETQNIDLKNLDEKYIYRPVNNDEDVF